ncbi:pq loop repeat protein [Colletotrichum kahawae]|uniref:Pq loop repeat protein n=1 Tax=Colletotrichum kahawae TaxID=34407 RepID=A0AAD9XWI3_COLKA|nr:pq loop repeat protein [Colletotrichum kahawae]
MDNPAAANAFGTLGAVLWSLQVRINIADNFSLALQIQPNILIFLSLWTWSQCRYYGDGWGVKKIIPFVSGLAIVLAGAEYGLVYALRLARQRGHSWPSILMAIVAAILLAGGVLRHYVQMLRTRSDAGEPTKTTVADPVEVDRGDIQTADRSKDHPTT